MTAPDVTVLVTGAGGPLGANVTRCERILGGSALALLGAPLR